MINYLSQMKKISFIFLSFSVFFLFSQVALAKEKWQVSLHYGLWSLSPVESIIENVIGDKLGTELKEVIGQEGEYSPNINLDSGGNNLAFEIRFYPAGKDGSFSIGLAVEKSELELILEALPRYELADGSYFQGSGNGKLLLEPASYHLSFRWDIKPFQRLHPYIGFGAGIGSLEGYLIYDELTCEFYDASTEELTSETYPGGEISLDDLLEYDQKIVLPIIQLNLGLNFEITNNLHVLLDVGIWDGFLVRGGLSLRL